MTERIKIQVVRGVEGLALIINKQRVAGPKPWGGGEIVHTWTVDANQLRDNMAEAGVLAREAGGRKRPSPHRIVPMLPPEQPPEHTARYLATDDARVAQAIADLRDDLGESED